MNSIKNRYEMMMLVEATMCNPNGDPDNGNLPRNDPETGIGYITDVSFKRLIRNYVEDTTCHKILSTCGASINMKIAEAVLAVNGIEKFDKNFVNKKVDESEKWMNEHYWDVRTFGGVLSTGRNAGQIRGAVQIAMASSVDPIEVSEITITRMNYTDGKDLTTLEEYKAENENRADDTKRTMGTKTFTPYGLYVVKASVSAALAEKNGFSEEDLAILQEAMLQMYSHNISSSKEGMSVVSPLIIFKHVGTQADTNSDQNAREAMLGCASAYKLFNMLSVCKKDGVNNPRKLSDYNITFKYSELPEGVEVELKEQPFSHVITDKDGVIAAFQRNGIEIG